MKAFANRAIAASAGTGKTWALVHRYLALLAAGVPPERICALTFSRKAAGEIFDTLVDRLCQSATEASVRRATDQELAREAPGLAAPTDAAGYLALLRGLLNQAHRLRIGTLDSFILGVVRAFPLELGIAPEAQPMNNDGGEAQALRQALLARLCDPRARERSPDEDGSGTSLLAAFRQATFGAESKTLTRRLDQTVARHHGFFRQHGAKAWGDAGRIWTRAPWWSQMPPAARCEAGQAAYREALSQAFGGERRAQQLGAACAEIAAVAAAHAPDRPWPGLTSAAFAGLLAGASEHTPPVLSYYGKSYPMPEALWPPLRAALANLISVELGRCQQQTAGLHALLGRYDTLYREALRVGGRLTFEDLSRLLAEPAHQPSRNAATHDKLYIDYRLDGQLDHWLLDEFQDTSDTQWQAISNLIDEIVQDSGWQRSFFYVGDVKQSIYGWRGGNHRLFGQVRAQCGIGTGEALVACHRSLPAVIETVNRVFDNLADWEPAAGAAKGPSRAALEAFRAEWKLHRSARVGAGQGYAALLQVAPEEGDGRAEAAGEGTAAAEAEGSGDPAQYAAVARVLEAVQPVAKGLSAAVLVRGNAQGRACADVLRRRLPGVPVVHEGTGGIVDNPVVTLLLALVQAAAHPGDTLATRHLQMSPLAPAAAAGGAEAWLEALPALLFAQVHAAGFAGALRIWAGRLQDCGALRSGDAFGQQRLRELLAAAEAFDATGSRAADAFLDHVRACQVKSEAASGAVRVMTIHQSKGLGFDLVLVPFEPGARSFADTRGTEFLRSDCGRSARDDGWVLLPPRREALLAAGEPLPAMLEAERAEQNFAQLCVLYVALTRAKQALYLLVPPASAKPTSVREADLLRERLAGHPPPGGGGGELPVLYAAGDPAWHVRAAARPEVDPQAAAAVLQPMPLTWSCAAARREPSKERVEGQPYPAAWLLSAEAGDVRAFGSALHRLFEQIVWIETCDPEQILAAWRAAAMESSPVRQDVEAQFRSCLADPAVRALLGRPAGAPCCQVWRETPFDYVREGSAGLEIVSGRFDRVVIACDAAGRPVQATVVDYKSNRVADAGQVEAVAAGYVGQMRDYAAAAAHLLELPAESVRAVLLFTRLAIVRPVRLT